MQEFTTQYKQLHAGILPHKESKNAGGLEDCFGILPSKGKLLSAQNVLNPRAAVCGFPFPQLFCGSSICWLTEESVLRLDNNFDLLSTRAVASGATWHVIDFGHYVLFTNGKNIVELNDIGQLALNTDLPRFSTGCNFNGQLFVGGFFAPFNGFGLGAIAWSKIGRLDFSLDKSNSAGLVNLGTNAEVLKILALDSFVVVGTTRGVHKFFPTSEHVVGFGRKDLDNIPGIISRDGMASNNAGECLLMDATGGLWIIGPESVQFLDYTYFFRAWIGCPVIITYNKTEMAYDITNGEVSYRLNKYGLGRINQAVTSQAHIPGDQIGTFDIVDGAGFLIVTNAFDFGFRGLKTITGVEVGGVFDGPVFVSVDWKNSQYKYFRSSPWVRLNNSGFARMRVCADEFRVKVQSAENNNVEIDYLAIKYQINDKRNVRGAVNADTNASRTDSE